MMFSASVLIFHVQYLPTKQQFAPRDHTDKNETYQKKRKLTEAGEPYDLMRTYDFLIGIFFSLYIIQCKNKCLRNGNEESVIELTATQLIFRIFLILFHTNKLSFYHLLSRQWTIEIMRSTFTNSFLLEFLLHGIIF